MIGTLLKLGGYALLAREAVDLVASSQYHQEREQSRKQIVGTVSGTLAGVAIGVGIGILIAPRPGRETREMLTEAACEQVDKLQSSLSDKTQELSECLSQSLEGQKETENS